MFASIETLIVGAGPAGLAVSEHLTDAGHDNVIVERGGIAETWRRQRWDGFRLNMPNWVAELPGLRGAFSSRDQLVDALEHRARRLPVTRWTEVEDVRTHPRGYLVTTSSGPILARHVVLAAGAQNVRSVPSLAPGLAPRVEQVHAGAYRNPDALPAGAILVVGAAQSGVQIAEELAEAGRHVLLATCRVGRVPRRHRGRDIFEWFREMGFMETPVEVAEREQIEMPVPQVSGTHGGHTSSY